MKTCTCCNKRQPQEQIKNGTVCRLCLNKKAKDKYDEKKKLIMARKKELGMTLGYNQLD